MPRIKSLASEITYPEPTASAVAYEDDTQAPATPAVVPQEKGGALAAYQAGQGFGTLSERPVGPSVNMLNRFSKISKYAGDVQRSLPTIKEGDWYVVTTEGENLKSFAAWLVAFRQLWTDVEWTTGKVISVLREDPGRNAREAEDIRALLLAVTSAGIVPCIGSFRKAATPWVHQMAAAIVERGGSWAQVIGGFKNSPRTAKGTGQLYVVTSAEARAVNADEMLLFTSWAKDPDAQTEFTRVARAFEDLVAKLDAQAR
jgi:hypothetical protein